MQLEQYNSGVEQYMRYSKKIDVSREDVPPQLQVFDSIGYGLDVQSEGFISTPMNMQLGNEHFLSEVPGVL